MLTTHCRPISIIVWSLLMFVTWVLYVPGHLSVSNWIWLNLGSASLAWSVNLSVDRMKPTPTVAQILYDVEHQSSV